MSTENASVLNAENVARTYEQGDLSVNVLSDVSIHIRRGERVAIIGSSGSGKSTLLHVLGGLDTPNKGNVELAGQTVHGLSQVARGRLRNKHVGFVYQFHHLLHEFSAVENVADGLIISRILTDLARENAKESLQMVLVNFASMWDWNIVEYSSVKVAVIANLGQGMTLMIFLMCLYASRNDKMRLINDHQSNLIAQCVGKVVPP